MALIVVAQGGSLKTSRLAINGHVDMFGAHPGDGSLKRITAPVPDITNVTDVDKVSYFHQSLQLGIRRLSLINA
ncbi:hypothetical protein ACAW74_14940 [Fibrella sp. WM1]